MFINVTERCWFNGQFRIKGVSLRFVFFYFKYGIYKMEQEIDLIGCG